MPARGSPVHLDVLRHRRSAAYSKRVNAATRVENGLGLWQLKVPSARFKDRDRGARRPGSLSGLTRQGAFGSPQRSRVGTDRDLADTPRREASRRRRRHTRPGRGARGAVGLRTFHRAGGRARRRLTGRARPSRTPPSPARSPPERRAGEAPARRRHPGHTKSERLLSEALGRLREMFRNQQLELLCNDPVIRISDNIDAVHDMHVAVHRLRSVLRTARSMLRRQWVDSLRAELDWLAQPLGAVRDLDVFVNYIEIKIAKARSRRSSCREASANAPGRAREAREQLRAASRNLATTGSSTRSTLPPKLLESAAATSPSRSSHETSSAASASAPVGSSPWATPSCTRCDPNQASPLRRRARRARTRRPATRFIKSAIDVQGILGEHQDAVVAGERIRHLAHTAADQEPPSPLVD